MLCIKGFLLIPLGTVRLHILGDILFDSNKTLRFYNFSVDEQLLLAVFFLYTSKIVTDLTHDCKNN